MDGESTQLIMGIEPFWFWYIVIGLAIWFFGTVYTTIKEDDPVLAGITGFLAGCVWPAAILTGIAIATARALEAIKIIWDSLEK